MNLFKRAIVYIIFFGAITKLVAQESEKSLSISLHKGFIFAHSKDVENTANSYPNGILLEYTKQLLDDKTWENCNCYPRKGYFIQYFDYDNAVLGKSIQLGTFIEPYWGYGKRIGGSLKGMAGLGYFTNPYHPTSNPTNQSYSLPISAYIALGIGLHMRIASNYQMNLYGNYNHVSNGGIKNPNKGINWPTLSLGLNYIIQSAIPPTHKRVPFNRNTAIREWETFLYWSSRTVKAGEKQRWQIVGIGGQYLRQVSKISALSIGAELWYDFSLQERLRRDDFNSASSFRSGILGGHAFLMGKISLSQQLGIYFINPTGYFNLIYQRYGFAYRVHKKWSVGTNVLVHGHVANFLDFRLIYRFDL
jgi:hypothetical protein